MRTRSASLVILLALSAGTVAAVAACSPDVTEVVATSDIPDVALDKKIDDLRERYGWTGKYHTDGLAYIYDELVKNSGKLQTRQQICRTAAKALKEFHRAARKGEVPFALVDPSLQNEACPSAEGSPRISMNVVAGEPRISMNELSPAAVSYMDQLANAINMSTSRSQFISSILNVQYAAAAALSIEEAGAVVAAASIAISSADYWEANLDAWIGIQGPADPYVREANESGISQVPFAPMSIGKPKWWDIPFIKGYRRVVSADIVGGARVLYTTWYAGPVAWEGAAAGALWASATTAFALIF